MRKYCIALAAIAVVAAMCIAPFAVMEDAEAASMTTGEKGVSFKASTISNDDLDKLMSEEYKQQFAALALSAVVSSVDTDDPYSFDGWTMTDIKVTNMKDVKLAQGEKYATNLMKHIYCQACTYDIEVTATYSGVACTMFTLMDGTQDLYKALDGNKIGNGTVLKIKGTMTTGTTLVDEIKLVKNEAGNFVQTQDSEEITREMVFNGTVGYKSGTIDTEITWKSTAKSNMTQANDYDFGDVKPEKATDTTRVFITPSVKGASEGKFEYKVGDVKGGYSQSIDSKDLEILITGIITYEVDDATVWNGTYTVSSFYFYDATSDRALFNEDDVNDSSLKSNDEMKKFLDKIGTIGEEFSDAESVTNSAKTSVGGSSNLVIYAGIGIAAIAVIAIGAFFFLRKSAA